MATTARGEQVHARTRLAYLALAAVCVFWGTTYLGIRIAIESLPPLYLIAIRYTLSGWLLLIALMLSGHRLPRRRELLETAWFGALTISTGNGFLAIAEQWIPSGLAALFVSTQPFWMVILDGLLPGGSLPSHTTVQGLLVGLAGVAWLVLPQALHEGLGGATATAFLLLQLGQIGWVTGSLLQRRQRSQASPVLSGAIQQIATGIFMFLPAVLFERLPKHVSLRSELAVVYLVIFGSIIGYSAFVYSMARLPVPVVSIYTFVNPIVAVVLGYLFFREPCGPRELLAMLLIFAGIAVVKRSDDRRRSRAALGAPASEAALAGTDLGPEQASERRD